MPNRRVTDNAPCLSSTPYHAPLKRHLIAPRHPSAERIQIAVLRKSPLERGARKGGGVSLAVFSGHADSAALLFRSGFLCPVFVRHDLGLTNLHLAVARLRSVDE